MPIPKPKEGETQEEFGSRCMGAIGGEHEDKKQAYAICMNTWRESKKGEESSAETESSGENRTSEKAFIVSKADKRFVVGGYANVFMIDKDGKVIPDRQNEVVALKALDEAFQTMMIKESRRNHMYWHTNMQIGELIWEAVDSNGTLWKSHVVYEPNEQYTKKGLFILSELFPDNPLSIEAMKEMENGGLLEFSIGEFPLETEHKCDSDKCWTEVTKLYLGEASSCENAINVESKAFVLKALDETQKPLDTIDERVEAIEKALLLKKIMLKLDSIEKALKQ